MTLNADAEGRDPDTERWDPDAERWDPAAKRWDPAAETETERATTQSGATSAAESSSREPTLRRTSAVADAAGLNSPEPTADSGEFRHGVPWWITASVAIGFGLFYAYDLFEAISNLIGVTQLNGIATDAGIGPPVPWILPIITVALPPVAYAAALLVGRGHRIGTRALLFLTGLASIGALTLSVTALVSYF